MDVWEITRWIHLLAMGVFVGGQIMLAAVVVPVMRGEGRMRLIARKFGMTAGIAVAVAILTGMLLASEYGSWDEPALQAKLGLLVVVGAIVAVHTRRPGSAALNAALLIVSLGIVAFGVALSHGG